ncbi:hypothetical protein CC86DRAFT_372667 [Ophiobolus disseminans]|uniref:Uncharacterized protein n=1 Tax=Ophiobolus disseminans TaxID=1469910 RepID=A0A6A6ZP48_9PLEO|nr:hypothetical protein CC86DRAFT_372667 [Ophiobolus disseminans]
MVLPPPYALFVLDASISKEFLDDCLQRAHDGDPTPGWSFWVASTSYADMPAPPQTDKPDEEGTEPPLPDSWTSHWIGKTVEECAQWLQKQPTYEGEKYYLDSSVRQGYFVAMDEWSKEDGTMLVCRVSKKEDGEELNVDFFPQRVEEVQMQMWTNEGSMWENKAQAYRDTVRKEGKPDRSRF